MPILPIQPLGTAAEVFGASLKLGLTSFGGPIAHLAYFERTYVRDRRWVTAQEYAGIVGLCQLLPGPSSSQVGFLLGYRRAGLRGALAAWTGFTLPSALLMYLFALLAARAEGAAMHAIVRGLLLTAVAVVGQAVWRMAQSLCPDWRRRVIGILAAVLLLLDGSAVTQLEVMAIGALAGLLVCRPEVAGEFTLPAGPGLRTSWMLACTVGGLLVFLPALAVREPRGLVAFMSIFYRSGAVVFGGGHVVLPILRDALVPSGWMSDGTFLTGYGFAQALPGPLFTVAAYLGAVSATGPASVLWASVALIAIFLPGLTLAIAGMSLWSRMVRAPGVRPALAGVNAAVVGILGAAFYHPVWTSAIHGGADAVIAIAALGALVRWNTPPILAALLCVAGSAVASAMV
jgi:chromate transporter